MPTHQKSFDRVNDILKQSNKIFIVPVFQRPYAWDQNHKGKAKAYQVKQVLLAIEKLEVEHATEE